MLDDMLQVRDAGYSKDGYFHFVDRLQNADSHFRNAVNNWSSYQFIIDGKTKVYGGDINYYMQGFAHASRDEGAIRARSTASILTVGHNVVQGIVNQKFYNIQQIGPGMAWTMRGHEFYKANIGNFPAASGAH